MPVKDSGHKSLTTAAAARQLKKDMQKAVNLASFDRKMNGSTFICPSRLSAAPPCEQRAADGRCNWPEMWRRVKLRKMKICGKSSLERRGDFSPPLSATLFVGFVLRRFWFIKLMPTETRELTMWKLVINRNDLGGFRVLNCSLDFFSTFVLSIPILFSLAELHSLGDHMTE